MRLISNEATAMGKRFLLLAMGVMLASACASAGGSATEQGAPRVRRDPNVITADELATVQEGDAYSAIQRLRPNFLVTRGGSSINMSTGIQVYLENNSRLGGIDALRQIPVTEIKEIRYFSATEATQRYGTGVPNGAIVIVRK